MKKKIVMATGGTGGHIFPALSLALELLEKRKELEITFAGHGLEGNPYFLHQNFSSRSIPSDSLSSKNPFKFLKGLYRLTNGLIRSNSLLKQFSPDLVIGFGSYYTLPILSSAILKRIPLILHEANAVPGKINRLFAPYSSFVGVHFSSVAELLRAGKAVDAPLPLRPGYRGIQLSKEEARRHLGLFPSRPTLLVFGGSQGALSLNQLFVEAVNSLMKTLPPFQVIHFVGKEADEKRRIEGIYRKLHLPAFVASFITDMRYPLRGADLAVVRSGASTVAELTAFSLPAIYIPYPRASDNHQEQNGRFIADVVGGGLVVREVEATPNLLSQEIASLFQRDRLTKMEIALKTYENSRAGLSFADTILRFLDGEK
jgi:UDP-N-acetylglucosamine--N-acetylmuramyl-(pentapeptide) pyrophosphoryl-undecaprenol N-acetylglucosamine transferase